LSDELCLKARDSQANRSTLILVVVQFSKCITTPIGMLW